MHTGRLLLQAKLILHFNDHFAQIWFKHLLYNVSLTGFVYFIAISSKYLKQNFLVTQYLSDQSK